MTKAPRIWIEFLFFCLIPAGLIESATFASAECVPDDGCGVALAYYNVSDSNDTLNTIASRFQTTVTGIRSYNTILNSDSILGQKLLIPFVCHCGGDQLGHNFTHTVVQGDHAEDVAQITFENLTRLQWMQNVMGSDLSAIYAGNNLTIPVNCSCGDPNVNQSYGLFATYVAEEGDNLTAISQKFNNISTKLLQDFNSGLNWDNLSPYVDIIFVPAKDGNGSYPSFNFSSQGKGSNASVIVGASVGAAVALLLIVGLVVYYYCVRGKHQKENGLDKHDAPLVTTQTSVDFAGQSGTYSQDTTSLSLLAAGNSVEFSYEELAVATDNFSIAKKIGEGGYGSVYLGEVRGQRLAIKMMNMKATKEFFAELKVLTRVHHTNLVHLVGYCTVDYLFLVYEYMDNGALSQHLKFSGREGYSTLSWAARVKVALDAARGLEYIHEHTTPTYVHRDIKSSNILLDKNFQAKVSDFGLAKLSESGGISATLPSRLVGTFGYMAPEYARFGDVTTKADVFAFGVVLFELISAKDAIIYTTDSGSVSSNQTKGLVTLFEEILDDTNGLEKIHTLVDPALEDNYPLEVVWKMAKLAGACTKADPALRPNMRVVVVALMTLSSSTQDWDVTSVYQEHGVEHSLSGR